MLDQYGTECFGRLVFATVRKSVGLKELTRRKCAELCQLTAVERFADIKENSICAAFAALVCTLLQVGM